MEKCELLTLDIWDTIIRRKCHPDEIKLSTSRYMFFTYHSYIKTQYKDIVTLTKERILSEREIGSNQPKEYDDEYSIKDVFKLWCKKVFENIDDTDICVEKLYQYELLQEKNNTYLDPVIVKKINSIQYKKIAYISDFYADHEFLDEILNHIGFPIKFDYKYVSCEQKLNKRSGRLFEKVFTELSLKPADIIHIGDNKNSDYAIPISKGMNAIHYIPKEEHEKRINREKLFNLDKYTCYDFKNEKNILTGIQIAPFFYNLVLWITENCLINHIRKIYFFTREGEFFKQIYDLIYDNNPFDIELPEAKILEVSRIATFGASLREITLKEMMRIWNQYSIQSMEAFFSSISVDITKIISSLNKYQIDLEEVITYPWLDDRIIHLFNDNEFVSILENEVKTKKQAFLNYSNEKGLSLDENCDIAIVDIGWRGTIQDNICYMYPNYRIHGFYVGLIPFLNEQPVNSIKYSYLENCEYKDAILRNVTPFEMISNSPNGSVVGYKLENNKYLAIRKKDKYEDEIFYKYTKHIQNEIVSECYKINKQVKRHNILSESCKSKTYELLYSLICNPKKDLVNAYFNLRHNEEFGVGAYVDKRVKFKLLLMIKAVFNIKSRIELKEYLIKTTWPQGYLVKYHLNIAMKLFNEISKRRHLK